MRPLLLGLAGVVALVAALLMAFLAANVKLVRWEGRGCFTGCGRLPVYTIWEGVPLAQGVNVTVTNTGSSPVLVEGHVVPPGGSLTLRGAAYIDVSSDSGSCEVCVRVAGWRVVQPYALLSIPAAVLSIIGFALVIYSLYVRVFGVE